MSASSVRKSTAGGDALHPTRQQLDELDALLQRMLALPVHPLEEGAVAAGDPDTRAEVDVPREPALPLEAPPERSRPRPLTGSHGASSRAWEAPAERSWSAPAYPASYMVVENVVPPPEAAVEPGPEANLGPRISRGVGREEPPVPAPHDNALTEMPGRTDLPVPVSAEEWVPLRSSWQPSPHTWGPLADTWQHARPKNERQELDQGPPSLAPTASPPPLRAEAPSVVPPLAAPPPARLEAGPSQAPPLGGLWEALAPPGGGPSPVSEGPIPPDGLGASGPLGVPAQIASAVRPTSWGALPLVAFNRAFDLALMPWGHAGRWLQRPTGRNVLGSVGVLCLAVAAALAVADGLGWTW